jgi:hypothetical protein
MLYYAKPAVLSDSNPSNQFMAICPDALLYGALVEAEPYLNERCKTGCVDAVIQQCGTESCRIRQHLRVRRCSTYYVRDIEVTMAELSDYLENKLLDHVLRGTSYTSPTTVFMGLYTSDPGDGNSGTECTGGAYARQIVSVTTATGGIVTSSADVTFPQATDNWGTISHIGLLDAITSGNLLMHTPLTTSKAIELGDIFKVPLGNLTATLD